MTDQPFSKEELQHLKELSEVTSTATTPGWMRIMKRLQEMVDDAKEDMLGAGDKPDIVLAPLARRWTQRAAMVRDIETYIASCQTEKDALLQSLRSDPPNEDGTA